MSEELFSNEALLSVAPPALAPMDLDPLSSLPEDYVAAMEEAPEEPAHPKASWLDAMQVIQEPIEDLYDGQAAISSDENGLYHMFVGVTP